MNVDDLYTAKGDDAVVLHVHVQPGAGRSAVVGRHGTALKVRVAAPPVGGRANVACAELLAEEFGLKSAQVALVGGDTSRSKTFTLSGLDLEEFRRHLEQVVGTGRPGQPRRRPRKSPSRAALVFPRLVHSASVTSQFARRIPSRLFTGSQRSHAENRTEGQFHR